MTNNEHEMEQTETVISSNGRKNVNGDLIPRVIDNTAQSMSTSGTTLQLLIKSKMMIYVVLVSALS